MQRSSTELRRRVLLTGATGFLGSSVWRYLEKSDVDVVVLCRRETDLGTKRIILGDGAWPIESLATAIQDVGPSAIIHMAGVAKTSSLEDLYAVNVLLAERVMSAARQAAPLVPLLLVGSAAEYGSVKHGGIADETDPCLPHTNYGITKLAQTLHALSRARQGQSVIVARLFNPVGQRMPLGLAFSDFANRMRSADSLAVGNLDVQRDFFSVHEAARIICELAFKPEALGKVVNICSGVAQPLRLGLERLIERWGRPITIFKDPALVRPEEVVSIRGGTSTLDSLGIRPASPEIGLDLDNLIDALRG